MGIVGRRWSKCRCEKCIACRKLAAQKRYLERLKAGHGPKQYQYKLGRTIQEPIKRYEWDRTRESIA